MSRKHSYAIRLEREWAAHGLLCRVCTNLCLNNHLGFIRVEKGHPFFGVDKDESVALNPNKEKLEDGLDFAHLGSGGLLALLSGKEKVDQWLKSPDGYLKVHGGLGFSASYCPCDPDEKGDWWFGWDAGHPGSPYEADDYVPFQDKDFRILVKVRSEREEKTSKKVRKWKAYLARLDAGEMERDFSYEAKLYGQRYWTVEDMIPETEKLAEQLSLVALLGIEKGK